MMVVGPKVAEILKDQWKYMKSNGSIMDLTDSERLNSITLEVHKYYPYREFDITDICNGDILDIKDFFFFEVINYINDNR
jgi:hypothetical protein